jgi:arsenate reductase (glutaredoxin)
MITIYYNPKCSKCRIAKEDLESTGENFEVVEYLKTPITERELKSIIKKLGLPLKSIIRTKEEVWKKFVDKNYSDEELVQIVIQHPILLQRPIIVKGNKAIIAREEGKVKEFI